MNVQLLWLTTGLALLDQFAKAWVVKHLSLYEIFPLFAGFSIERIHNYSGQDWLGFSPSQASVYLPLFGVAFLLGLMGWLRMNASGQRLTALAFCIMAAGVLSSTADWAIYGHGIEFLRVSWLESAFGTVAFSLGDFMMLGGFLLYIVDSFVFDALRKNTQTAFDHL